MTDKAGPPLEEGEHVIHDHIPSVAAFQKNALLLLVLSLGPTFAFAATFKDSVWTMLPIFLTAIVLLQERLTLGRHRAWVTNRRVIFQKGREVPLFDVRVAVPKTTGVKLETSRPNGPTYKLTYPADREALAALVNNALKGDAA